MFLSDSVYLISSAMLGSVTQLILGDKLFTGGDRPACRKTLYIVHRGGYGRSFIKQVTSTVGCVIIDFFENCFNDFSVFGRFLGAPL